MAGVSNVKALMGGVVGVIVVAVVVWLLMTPGGGGGVTNVDSTGLREALANGATMLDVRSQGEYEAAHIPGAMFVDYASFGDGVANLPKDRAYIVYCASGSRSSEVVAYMETQGFSTIYHLNQGLVTWEGALVGGPEAGNVADALAGSAVGPSESMLAQALRDPLVAPNGTPVMVEFRSDG